jgi:hypothetical protein
MSSREHRQQPRTRGTRAVVTARSRSRHGAFRLWSPGAETTRRAPSPVPFKLRHSVDPRYIAARYIDAIPRPLGAAASSPPGLPPVQSIASGSGGKSPRRRAASSYSGGFAACLTMPGAGRVPRTHWVMSIGRRRSTSGLRNYGEASHVWAVCRPSGNQG